MPSIDPVLARIDADLPDSIERLCGLLRIPSVSADPARDGDCRHAAEAVAAMLTGMGFTARLAETPAHPVVIADYAPGKLDPHAPHVLFYGHYDVQPADPLALWTSPPFEPVLRTDSAGDKRIYARGASDDKGQFMTFLEASRAWLATHGSLPFRLTVIIEGDEETDSSHIDDFLRRERAALAADVALVCDTDLWAPGVPAITTRLRGCMAEEVVITGAKMDLHSGGYGGSAANPIHVLGRIMGDLRDGTGRITIPGFYDGVDPVPEATLRQWQDLAFDEKAFLTAIGLSEPVGETGFSALERLWVRPTAEVNGILGGYTGPGGKTIIPSEAMAKFTFRLVGKQDPAKIRTAFRQFVQDRLPQGCRVRFDGGGGESAGVTVAEDNPFLTRAASALAAEWGRAPAFIGSGGSIPIVEAFQRLYGMPSLLIGFAQDADTVHSPNESYAVSSYHKGQRSWARVIAALATP